MGFTEQQARIGLKRTRLIFFFQICFFNHILLSRYDIQAAMDLLLTESDIVDDESDQENESNDNNKSVNLIIKIFN
jgi:hypothetical protein